LEIETVLSFLLIIVGSISIAFALVLIMTYRLWHNKLEFRNALSKFYWEIFCPAIIIGFVICVVPVLFGSEENGERMWTNLSALLASFGFCSLLISGGVVEFWGHKAKE